MVKIALTPREKRVVLRHREGTRLEDLAKVQGVHRNTICSREKSDDNEIYEMELTPTEFALISRRRLGWTQQKAAEILGCSRFWYNQMEKGNVPNQVLTDFWSK